ncbi:DUF4435 domain-containing protein [Acinetobacter baumannii]|nr:DUF4435 domain-containing protein [Acinetobacter baumannii]MDO7406303.1 DUF4435 domain-containing protein [Acinetobacter baumannii]
MNNLMQSRVDFMTDKLEDESVAFQVFLKNYKKDKAFFFLEGVDDLEYYLSKIENFFGDYSEKWVEIVCYGRDKVIKIINDLNCHTKKEYRESAYFGIIDKDYYEVDDNPFKNKIYVTPCYSIENFYISTKFFKKVLKVKFFLRDNDDKNNDYARCLKNFLKRRGEFIHIVSELDKYLRCNHIMYEENKIESKINLRDLDLINLINIHLDRVVLKKSVLDFIGKKIEDFDSEALEKAGKFYKGRSEEELSQYIRGKFMYFFINHYLHCLRHDNMSRTPILFVDSYANSKKAFPERVIMRKTNLNHNVQKRDCLSILVSLSDTPKCLKTFLSEAYEMINEAA